ncbi:hypothetical protein IM660_01915 [Ruania alkalisoli]|uniref:LamG-like jellyroll fold domain-containing protein n=1 Tax=Ruania alkalisoli TaxID=2779775 RepID=A0A7M1SVV2_9MICO|nr:LamG-like jellyroll fold domain-containing protein [Ruania alkalisoli]QOR71094.1 hypothetical protein IM660_01915 [Ruania alkalisoli]
MISQPFRFPRAVHVGTASVLMLALASAPAAASDPPPEPVAAWSFDAGSGDVVVDETGGGHDGVVEGGTWGPGRIGGGLYIDGYDDGVLVEDESADLGMDAAMSIEARINLTDQGTVQKIVERAGNYGLRISADGRIGFRWEDQWRFSQLLDWEEGRWYHVAVTYDGDEVTFYRDGAARGTATTTRTATVEPGTVYLGRGIPDWERTLYGTLDEVALYDESLTADQVRAHYDAAPAQTDQAPQMGAVRMSAYQVEALTMVELTADIDASVANPDDPNLIDVQAQVRRPGGEVVTVPGFLYQDFRLDGERVVESGAPVWTARYTPPEPGTYQVRMHVTTDGGAAASPWQDLSVTPAPDDARGFVTVNPDNPRYFQFERTAETFFPMGVNLDIPVLTRLGNHHAEPDSRYHGLFGDDITSPAEGASPENLYAVYEEYRRAIVSLAEAGGNAVRLRLDSWWLPLEIDSDYPIPGYSEGVPGFDVGRYHAANAWIADQVVELAEQYGLYVTPVTWNQHSPWGGSAYATPGGENEQLTDRRLRYQVARWSYSTHMYGWSFFNETRLDMTTPFYTEAIEDLRAIDPNPHLVFNSYTPIDQEVEHAYRCDDDEDELKDCWGEGVFLDKAEFAPGDDMPLVLEEYGKKWYFRYPVDDDPNGYKAHEGLWASIMGHRSGALYWWQYTHLGPLDLYDEVYSAAAAFLNDVELGDYEWEAAELTQTSGPGGLQYFGMTHAGPTAGDRPNGTDGPRALLWVVRTPSDEYVDRAAVDGNEFTLAGTVPGSYRVEWIDTWTGEHVDTQTVRSTDGDVPIEVPDGVTRDIAAQVYGPLGEMSMDIVAPTQEYLAGQTTRVEVTFTNTNAMPGAEAVELMLEAPEGWDVATVPQSEEPTDSPMLMPGEGVQAAFDVTAPDTGYAGDLHLTAAAEYRHQGHERRQHATMEVRYAGDLPPEEAFGSVQSPLETFASTDARFGQRGNTFLVAASGGRIWESVNEFGTIYLDDAAGPSTSVTTTVAYQQNTHEAARAGLMLRNDISGEESPTGYVLVAATAGRGYVMNVDIDGDGGMDRSYRTGTTTYPARLMLERDRDHVTGYYAEGDGVWQQIATVEIVGAAEEQDVGLFVTANNAEATSRADFIGFEIE